MRKRDLLIFLIFAACQSLNAQTVFYNGAPASWEADVRSLLELAVEVQQHETDRKRWSQILEEVLQDLP